MGIQPIRKIVAPEIPDKLYFRIGDVAQLCEVPAYVLRFWETEFPQLKPGKGGTGQRLYRKRDVEIAMRIKSLLYDQGFTIAGARQVFKNETKAREAAAAEAFLPTPAPASSESSEFSGHLEASQAAAPALPEASAVGHPAATDPGADIRRQVKLRALRDEMKALLNLLNGARTQEVSSQISPQVSPQASPQLKPMRPRLVLEPRPMPCAELPGAAPPGAAPPRPAPLRADTLRLVREPRPAHLFASE